MRINGASIRRTAVNLSLLLVACAAGLVLCEVSLRLFYPKYEHLAQARFRDDARLIWSRKPNSQRTQRHPDTGFSHTVLYNDLALRQSRNFSADDLTAATNIGRLRRFLRRKYPHGRAELLHRAPGLSAESE